MTPLKRLGLGSVRDLAQAVFTPAWEKKFLKDCEKGKRRDIEMYLFMQLFGKPSDTLKVQNADGSAFLGGLDNLAQTLQDRLRPVIPAQIVEGLPPLILPLPPSPPKRPSKNGAGPQSNAMEQP